MSETRTEADEHRRRYLDYRPGVLRRLPGPGKRPDEIARAEERRKAALDATEAAKAQRATKAAETRQLVLDRQAALKAFGDRVESDLGQLRQRVRLAVESLDYDTAAEAALTLAAVELVAEELRKEGQRFAAAHHGPSWFAVSAGTV